MTIHTKGCMVNVAESLTSGLGWQGEKKRRKWDRKGHLRATGSVSLFAELWFCPASLYAQGLLLSLAVLKSHGQG